MVDRRKFITSVATAGAVSLAGCSGDEGNSTGSAENEEPSGESDDQESSGESSQDGLTDSVIDADPSDVIVTLDDLEAGWSGGVEDEGEAYFFNEGRDVELVITDHSDIPAAETAYDNLKSENTANTASDEVSYGMEGFLVNPGEDIVVIGFRAANFVVKVNSFTQESSLADPENFGREFAEMIVEKITNAQGS
jgi:hypothetical protein